MFDGLKPKNESLVWGVLERYQDMSFADPTPLAPYYTLKLKGWEHWDSLIYVPTERVIGSGAGWTYPKPATEDALRDAIDGLEPETASVRSASVDGVPAEDVAAFVPLLDEMPPTQAVLGVEPMVIEIKGLPGAWVDPDRPIEYFPEQNVVHRKYQWLQASDDVVAVIEGGDAGRPSPIWLAPLALVGLALAGASVWLVRRRPRWRGRERERLVGG